MKQGIAALLSGVLFGVGLAVSGMLIPDKVLNFLDIAGYWDPSLALVMGGAIAVTLPGFYLVTTRERPLLAEVFSLPSATEIDSKLLAGAALFGLGWGLSGLCPAPALVNLASGLSDVLVFHILISLVLQWFLFVSPPLSERSSSHPRFARAKSASFFVLYPVRRLPSSLLFV